MEMRILAVDPGEKRIGIAISDPTGTIANPLMVLIHISRPIDSATIASIAQENDVRIIVVGYTLDDEGEPTPQGRRAGRLADAIRNQVNIPVELWEESDSTSAARQARIMLGVKRRNRQGRLDDLAATYILQTYLDSHENLNNP